MDDETSVRVALRIRPQIAREKIEMCRVCTSVTPGEPQVVLGSDKAFTFDHVFDVQTVQEEIYEACVSQLLEGCFDGYNATVLAYGQTGSGKTYTMGTAFDVLSPTDDFQGIIPRAVNHIFDGIRRRKTEAAENGSPEPFFQVSVQFIELYREEILDLLDATRDVEASRTGKSNIKIHEDHQGNIYMTGVATSPVQSAQETMDVLRSGALTRTTAKTNMNAQSSRSHAIFTMHVSQQRFLKQDPDAPHDQNHDGPQFETLSAKFHFVDLAGSERLKRTGATGLRAEEGININCGLLALGNVISALGDVSRKVGHVPYRDSKLTRLLQDSLGGNSRTLMIACISPSDCDFLETLNTLKYANRARNIKNKVVVNQDRSSRVISELRARIQALELELAEYKQGKRVATTDGGDAINDMYHENTLLQTELNQLRVRVKALQETQDVLRSRNAQLLCEMEVRSLKPRGAENGATSDEENNQLESMIKKYLDEIESLGAKLCESEATCQSLRQQVARYKSMMQNQQQRFTNIAGMVDSSMPMSPPYMMSVSSAPNDLTMVQSMNGDHHAHIDEALGPVSPLIDAAKAEIERLKMKGKEMTKSKKNGHAIQENGHGDGNIMANGSDEENNDEDSQDSESDEKEEELVKYQQDLADLQCEISMKERLVEELVQSQKRLQAVRIQYEEKLNQLQSRIQDTEMERDRILAALEKKQKDASEDNRTVDSSAAAKVRKDYEDRLSSLRNEMKRLQTAQREHERLAREQKHSQDKIVRLNNELQEMKKSRVSLMQKMKEEATRSRTLDLKRQKELAQMQKEARRRENELRELKQKDRQRDAVIKRKQEEIQSLRRAQRPQSARTVRPTINSSIGSTPNFNGTLANERSYATMSNTRTTNLTDKARRRSTRLFSRLAKCHWISIEKSITNQVVKKQTIAQMEQELERCMQNRDEKRRQLNALHQKKAKALETFSERAPMERSLVADIDDQIENVQSNIEYLQDQIAECQKQIMEVEEGVKEETEPQDQGSLFENCENLDEAKYLMEHLYNFCIAQGATAAVKETAVKEAEIKVQQAAQEYQVLQKLLQHMISSNPEACGLSDPMASSVESISGPAVPPPASFFSTPQLSVEEKPGDQLNQSIAQHTISTHERMAREKARRRTATPAELLYSEPNVNDPIRPALNVVFEGDDFKEVDEESSSANGSRTRDCSPETSIFATMMANGANHNGLGRSASCVEGGQQQQSKKPVPPPVPPKTHYLDQSGGGGGVVTRSKAIKRRPQTASISEGVDEENVAAMMAAMTVSDTMVPMRRTNNRGEPNGNTESMGSTTSLNVSSSPFVRGVAGRNTIAVSDNLSANRKPYGSLRSNSTKTGSADLHMKKHCSPVIRPPSFANTTPTTSSNHSGPSSSGITPPPSPRLLRRQIGHMNVFNRLIPAVAEDAGESESYREGGLVRFEGRQDRTDLLTCAFIGQGHTKGVLSVVAVDKLMASGSKDRTVKLWDLSVGKELTTLGNHPNNVQCVRLNLSANLLFSASMGHVKVWDLRSMSCVKTLSSSGLTIDGEFSPGGGLSNDITITGCRQTTLGQNEAMIAQMDMSPSDDYLFTAAYNQVRLWDLRTFNAVGKLTSATSTPKSEVSCMKIIPSSDGLTRVAVGSRDHYIKIFELNPSKPLTGAFDSTRQLDPPHYDGVTCFASYEDQRGRWLFSGSRDQCLFKWNLDTGVRTTQIPKAHGVWILSMAFLPTPYETCLVSACREGKLRFWNAAGNRAAEKFTPLEGKLDAHSGAINSMTTNDGLIYTASSDCNIGIWKPRDNLLSRLSLNDS